MPGDLGYACLMEAGPTSILAVDARGLRCPLPVLRLRRAAVGCTGMVELLTDDPAAETDVPAFVAEMGWALLTRHRNGAVTNWRIQL